MILDLTGVQQVKPTPKMIIVLKNIRNAFNVNIDAALEDFYIAAEMIEQYQEQMHFKYSMLSGSARSTKSEPRDGQRRYWADCIDVYSRKEGRYVPKECYQNQWAIVHGY